MRQRAVTVAVFSQWLLDGRVIPVQESPAQEDQGTENDDDHLTA